MVPESAPHKVGLKSQARDSGSTALGIKRLKMAEPENSSRQPLSSVTSLPNTGVPKGCTSGKTAPVLSTQVSERGSSVDLPNPTSQPPQSLPNQLSHLPSPAQMMHPPSTGNDVIKEHPTANTIIEEYWKQRKVLDPGSKQPTSMSLPAGFENAQSVFSAGNFSSLPIPGGTGPGRGNSEQNTSTDDHNSLANVNLSRLIPTLEALAGSLQDPNSIESRYLATLAAQTQMGANSDISTVGENLPVLSNGLDAPSHSNQRDKPDSMMGLDTPALLSGTDIASLLPSLANLDPSSKEFLSRQLHEGDHPDTQQPIYHFHTMKELSDRMQFIAASLGSSSGEDLAGKTALPSQQPSSLLLDSNFPMEDIPPPDNFVPVEHVSLML